MDRPVSSGPPEDPDAPAATPRPGSATGAAPAAGRRPGRARPRAGQAAAGYLLLLLFGAGQGVVGAFFYGGQLPVAALAFDALIFTSCVFGGWGMRTSAGGLAPAAGWLLTTFLLASATSGGSVVITNTSAGKWFLFGGAAAAAAGAITAFFLWPRAARGPARRTGWPGR